MRSQIIKDKFGDFGSIIHKYDYYFEGKIKYNMEVVGDVKSFLVISPHKVVIQLDKGLILYDFITKSFITFDNSSNVQHYQLYDQNNIVTYGYGYFKIWNLNPANNFISPSSIFEEEVRRVTGMYVLPDGRIALYGNINYIRIWNPYDNSIIRLEGHTDNIESLCVLGRDQLISGSGDNTIKIWDLSSYIVKRTLKGHSLGISTVDLFNDLIISSDNEGQIRIWNYDGVFLRSIKAYDTIKKLLFISDKIIGIYTYIRRKIITIWNIHTGKVETIITKSKYDIYDIQLLPNGNILSISVTQMLIFDVSGKFINGRKVNMNYGDQLFIMPLSSPIKILVNSKGKLLGLE